MRRASKPASRFSAGRRPGSMESKTGIGGQGSGVRAMWPAALAAVLFLVNALLTAPLFRIGYSTEMGSIEGAFIGLARYIRDHFPDLSWFPLWYGGIPYPDSYPPLLHWAVAGTGALFHISTGLAYHAVTAALFWTAWRLGANRAAAFVCALLYSLISPSCLLVREVRFDAGGWFAARRMQTLVHYGEGPHVTSLLFLALAIGLLHVALEKRRPLWYVLAALAMAATVLSNWIGGFALAVAVAAYVAAYGRLARTAALAAYAYALALPWVSPSTVATIRANAPFVGGRFVPNLAAEAAFAASFLVLAWIGWRLRLDARVRFTALFLYGTSGIALGSD